MSVKEDLKLDTHVDHALRRHEFRSLEEFLQKEFSTQKCSKELLLKLDQLVSRELDKKDVRNVSLVLNVIYKCSKCMTTSGEEWLTTAINQGLVEKMVAWYEKIREILIRAGSLKNEALITLTEDYFDIVMAVHDHNSDGKIQILEHFISKACHLVADTSISTFIKQEAVRKLNLMLDTIPREARKRLIFTKEMMATMSAMGKRILDAGDYDLQVAITEALCRMTSEAQRGELASHWFTMEFITTAFKGIKDSEFETDCRKFLNLVNGMLGDKRSVFTYPCISSYLDNHKFQTPSDEKLEAFWIDFNVGTQSISFYVSTDDNNESHQWETVCITESEVNMYNVEAIDSRTLLTVSLNTPTHVGRVKGNRIRIYFDSALDISDVVRKVFGANKCKGFAKKQTVSVAKTAVHIVFDESGSQILIPESQGSFASSKAVTVIDTSDIGIKKQPPLSTPYLNQQVCKENSSRSPAKLVTPSRSKVSEASINISVACGLKTNNSSASTKTPTLGKGRKKPPLEMISSAKRSMAPSTSRKDYTRHAKQSALMKLKSTAADMGTAQSSENDGRLSKEEPLEIVPDTQFTAGNNSVLLPGLMEKYLGSNKRHPMSTRQKEKISVSDDCISNKERACDIGEKQQTCSVLPSKKVAKIPMNEKGKDAAKTLVSKIGNKYSKEAVKRKQEDESFRDNLNKYSLQTNKDKPQNKNTKGSKQLNMDKAWETCRDDVYSFHSKGSDEPTIQLGVSSIFVSKQMVNIAVTNAGASSMKNRKSIKESEQKLKNPRKHLFSDTDTDRGGDDSKTEISWLQDTSSKKKPNIVGYSRQKQGNLPKEKTVSRRAADIAKQSRKQNEKLHKELCLSKKDAEETSKQSNVKRPQRATGKRKNSTESSNSESEEEPRPPSRKQTPKRQHGLLTTKKKQKNVEHRNFAKMPPNQPKMEKETVSSKISASVYRKPVSPVCSSPGSVEQMRSEQYESDPELPTKHPTIAHSSPSLSASPLQQQTPEESINILKELKKLNKQWTELSDKSASKRAQFTHRTGKKRDVGQTGQEPLSPAFSRLLQGTLTLDHSTVSGVNVLEVTGHEYNEQHLRMDSPVQNTSKTGVHTLKTKTKENICPSLYSGSSARKTSSCEMTCVNIHKSGPTLNDTLSYIKRINNERGHFADISTEGSDHEIKHKKIKLHPRKLFPSPDVQVPREHLSSVSGNNASTAATDTWDGSGSDVGMMCKQISKEFVRKNQNRSRKMDYFTKQSLKSAQKHLTSVDVQVRECRIMRLEKFHQTVLEEIESFEKDSQALKQMEKEFSSFWSQQTQVLNLYHKNEQKRIHCLKASFEMNVSHSTDYEETIFNSEMHAMKENMKAVQERLLKEMQEEELLSVRRGLQSLFVSGTGPF
ncbi:synaptonemal complex protein 2 isoform X2 [Rhinoderma darwinii]|uniref:synaptonemal complex protein 2 isoform X2 n=1 Tax=Rhinoderma darwinii TaxID=43563 RepID=UPI003F677FD2